ncbi:hypothetical protein LUZ60_004624 [Juncus effusus]|nr:hypothetical protein LUZ60_004624 [Juncus effusus]
MLGLVCTVIPRNTPIPVKKEATFITIRDNQKEVSIQVYEGERMMLTENHFLGEFDLSGIAPAPRGAIIDVCFDIDNDGILNVSATDRTRGTKNSIVITNEQGRLNEEEIERMIADAEKYKAEDAELKRKADARNKLEKHACKVRNAIRDAKFSNLVPLEKKTMVERAVAQALNWLDDNQLPDVADSEAEMQALKWICDPIITGMYNSHSLHRLHLDDE